MYIYGACYIIFYVHFFFLLIQKIDASWAFEKNKLQSPHLVIDFWTSSVVISRSFALLLSLRCKQKLYQLQACHIFIIYSMECLLTAICFMSLLQSLYMSKYTFSNVAIALHVSSECYVTIFSPSEYIYYSQWSTNIWPSSTGLL